MPSCDLVDARSYWISRNVGTSHAQRHKVVQDQMGGSSVLINESTEAQILDQSYEQENTGKPLWR